jgi:hypothetical protein
MTVRMLSAIATAALFGLASLSAPALAQQKTAKACQKEWAANKAALTASGKTQKAYIAECTGKTANAPKPSEDRGRY